MLYIIIIIIFIIICIFIKFWKRYIGPIFRTITFGIKDKCFPDITKNSEIFITLSTAAIVFTININNNRLLLNISRILFLACIATNIFLLFFQSLNKINGEIFLNIMTNDKGEIENNKKIKDSFDNYKTTLKFVLLFYYIQLMLLFFAISSLVLIYII